MKKLLPALLCFALSLSIKAQPYVTITDPVWAGYLTTNYPSCMNGNTLNGGCPALTFAFNLNLSGLGLTDVTGLQYFSQAWMINVSNNSLTALPPLSNAVYSLVANNNSISTIANIPPNCQFIYLQNNQLSYLPSVGTATGLSLYCGNNNITCFGPFPANSQTLDLLPNPFVCLPNHVPTAMNGILLSTPICTMGNMYNCPVANAISGRFYRDVNNNCSYNIGDNNLSGIGIKLYDNANNVVSQYYSSNTYSYGLSAPVGTYSARIDTMGGVGFSPQCQTPGWDSTNLVLSVGNPGMNNVNFNFDCNGPDVGCTSVWPQGPVFPGQQHIVRLDAGPKGLSALLCNSGISGQVVVTINGPVNILGPANGALVPLISGNTCTYNIADFGNIGNPYFNFGLAIGTLTSATIGNSVCVTVVTTPTAGDVNIANNTYTFCYQVGNSYDPNEKHTRPESVLPGYIGWFDYQVHFQNLGNAPAYNIRILDTLDTNLDLRTFQIVSSTDNFNVVLNGNIANFMFPNIMLPDSTSDPEGSKAMIHYRIKPKAGMVNGSKINNRAHIYFDYNPAVVTNKTVNKFEIPTALNQLNTGVSSLYPNPVKNKLNIVFLYDAQRNVMVSDVMGKQIFSSYYSSKTIDINTEAFNNGVYFVKITEGESSSVHKIIIEK